ncbi:ER degradation-enhancing alpha-mannosidase-like protein 2 [Lingula anatina]|uniref:alpha-1,2-Mannosidase n=1 Tax=Lingula anatina TaxID=7574 RepID=A0A1S3H7T5_LINAN|nr:ER degradation-enhancing alpha-mannosidase-like protein 2 [Lingula anatina]|eukprot:XP_013382068.1 ER degradation-enhancing alpha-mannosidase-like protein 2 [Lingula anatina]
MAAHRKRKFRTRFYARFNMVASYATESSRPLTKCFVLFILLGISPICGLRSFGKKELNFYRDKVVRMFHHAYDGYMQYAYPYDELRPITCDGHDTWGSFSLTLIDALDTLAIMGNMTEFRRVAYKLADEVDFDIDINASVFETNIRVVGGLLSAHLLTKRADMVLEPGWPCSGPLLRLAEDVARRLLPAFNTSTGMPYGTVNLRHGVPEGETAVTCTAGVATFIVEFGTLSKLTGDPIFEQTAMRALTSLWNYRSEIGLVGNHINVQTGQWTALDSGIGAGVDSYFEYLVKGAILLQKPELMEMFASFKQSIESHLKQDDWYMWVHMVKGQVTLPVFQSLEAFWPGLQSLIGDIDKAMKTLHNYHQVWKQHGFTPEFYNIAKSEVHQGREGYPLRPELIESTMYLYRATKDPYLLEVGVDILESIEHSTKTRCGYATVQNVKTHMLENRMESFFLAETTKYLYLLFDPENFIHNTAGHGTVIQTPSGECIIDAGGYVFNTEAHPVDTAALYCCSAEKHQDDMLVQDMQDNVNLLSLLDLVDNEPDMLRLKTTVEQGKNKYREDPLVEDIKQPSEQMPSSQEKNVGNFKSLQQKESDLMQQTVEAFKKILEKMNGPKKPKEILGSEITASSSQDSQLHEMNTGTEIPPGNTDTKAEKSITPHAQEAHSTVLENANSLTNDRNSNTQFESTSNTEKIDTQSASTYPEKNKLDLTKTKSTSGDSESSVATSQKKGESDSTVTVQQPQKTSSQPQLLPPNGAVNAKGDAAIKTSDNQEQFNSALKNIVQGLFQEIKTELNITCANYFSKSKRHKQELLTCPARPFHARLSVLGEMFLDDN